MNRPDPGDGHNQEDPDGLDQDIRDALAQALNEKPIRISAKLTDRRLLILYVLAIAYGAALLGIVDARTDDRDKLADVRDSLIVACQDTRSNAVRLNKALDQLAESSSTSPILTPAERRERAAFYEGLTQKVPTCPPRG